jgi:hypothetical protein
MYSQHGPEGRRKRARREDLELLKLEEEIKEKRVENLFVCMKMMTQIHPDWVETDDSFRRQAEEVVKNLIRTPISQLVEARKAPSSKLDQLAPLSITQVSRALGHGCLESEDFVRAEDLALKRYKTNYKTKPLPPTRLEIVDGVEQEVNVYTEADRELLKNVLTDLGIVGHSLSCSSSDSDE